MNILLSWLLNALIIFVVAYILPGVHMDSYLTALAVALVLGILNILVKPILVILTLPITLLTLGLFLIIINALLLLLTDAIVPGLTIDNFWWAVFFSMLVSVVNVLVQRNKDEASKNNLRRLR